VAEEIRINQSPSFAKKMMTRTLTVQQDTVDLLTVTRREEILTEGKYCLVCVLCQKINASKTG
jgi:hypothetical protein